MSYPMQGSCFCGAIRYQLECAPMFVHCCHCTDCQKQSGGAFVINALIETAHVTLLSGNPQAVPMHTDSGAPHDIYRCPQCKTALWSDYGRRKVMVFVRVATLEHPDTVPPDVHIFTRSMLPWERLPEGARAFSVYYDMQKEWPAESLQRRAALLGPGK